MCTLLFWIEYANSANLAGQPGLAVAAAEKAESLTEKMVKNKKIRKQLLDAAAIMKACAMIRMGADEDAYSIILERKRFVKGDWAAINYINRWATPLLKDKKKLSFVTGVDMSEWTGKYALPKSQPFYSLKTGEIVESSKTAVPDLKKGTVSAAALPSEKKKDISSVTILD